MALLESNAWKPNSHGKCLTLKPLSVKNILDLFLRTNQISPLEVKELFHRFIRQAPGQIEYSLSLAPSL